MAENVWVIQDGRSILVEFETPATAAAWGWFGNRSSGEGLEFATPEAEWTNHAWDRAAEFVMAAEAGGGAVTGTLALTTGGITFAGVGVETTSGALAATTGSITFAGVGVETETGTLAATLGSITFAGVGVETESGTLAFTTGGITFAGVGSVVTADATGTLGFTTGSIAFAGTGSADVATPVEVIVYSSGGSSYYFTYEDSDLEKKREESTHNTFVREAAVEAVNNTYYQNTKKTNDEALKKLKLIASDLEFKITKEDLILLKAEIKFIRLMQERDDEEAFMSMQ